MVTTPAAPAPSGLRRLPTSAALGAVMLLAMLLRLAIVVTSKGGFSGNVSYDPSVYYSAADALSFGRLPYRDFVLLHPPGLMLFLVPFAALGRLTTDHTGFVVANVAFMVIGSANAGLVVAIARRAGLTLRAAAVGGALYAVWYGAVDSEYIIRLEPLGTFFFLLALLCLVRVGAQRLRWTLLGGVALGATLGVKIWWAVPILAVLVWVLLRRPGRRSILAVLGGGAAALVAICLPFYAAAPSQMVRMVLSDQFGRKVVTTPWNRLNELTSLHDALPSTPAAVRGVLLVVIAAVVLWVCCAAWRVPRGRFFVCLFLSQLLVLVASPSYFTYYSGYPAGVLALTVAAAAQPREFRRLPRLQRQVPLVGVTVAAALSITALTHQPGPAYFPGQQLAPAVASARCVMADTPMALISLDVLSKGFSHGCRNWVDITGRTYDVDSAGNTARVRNPKWQRDIYRYLTSGDAFLTIRPDTRLAPKTRKRLDRYPVIATSGRFTIRGTHRSATVSGS